MTGTDKWLCVGVFMFAMVLVILLLQLTISDDDMETIQRQSLAIANLKNEAASEERTLELCREAATPLSGSNNIELNSPGMNSVAVGSNSLSTGVDSTCIGKMCGGEGKP